MDEPSNTVFAFDRDYTVSVNPHPGRDRAAVPLSWVKYLAHASAADVWATGNQRLRNEAAIPGVTWAKVLYDRLEDRSVEHETITDSDGSYLDESYWDSSPTRRQGLQMVRSVYEHPKSGMNAENLRFIVIDDIDLTDMHPEWEHFFSWDFVREFGGLAAASEGFCDISVAAAGCVCGELRPEDAVRITHI